MVWLLTLDLESSYGGSSASGESPAIANCSGAPLAAFQRCWLLDTLCSSFRQIKLLLWFWRGAARGVLRGLHVHVQALDVWSQTSDLRGREVLHSKPCVFTINAV